ncbi:hypothetical protein Tco_0997184 [Tanacetum coccineum]
MAGGWEVPQEELDDPGCATGETEYDAQVPLITQGIDHDGKKVGQESACNNVRACLVSSYASGPGSDKETRIKSTKRERVKIVKG